MSEMNTAPPIDQIPVGQIPTDDLRFQRVTKAPLYANEVSKDENLKSWLLSFFSTSYGAAIIIAFLTALILITCQPPFVKKNSTSIEEGSLDFWLIFVWTVIAGLFVLLIPTIRRFCVPAFTPTAP